MIMTEIKTKLLRYLSHLANGAHPEREGRRFERLPIADEHISRDKRQLIHQSIITRLKRP